jgi:ABC-type cobalamin/Fe3+-siderophores transport system ATPase subunit
VAGEDRPGKPRLNRDCSLLHQVSAAWSRSVVMVTHDPGIAAYADRIIFLKDGLVVDKTRLGTSSLADIKTRVAAL